MLRQLLFVAYLVEAGLVLLIVPWSGLWERNAFIQMAATWIVDIARSGWARGAVSGIGLMLVGAGLAEAVSIRTPTPLRAVRSGGRPIVTLPRPCICLVTDRSRLPPPSPDAVTDAPALGPLAERLTLAGQAGVDLLQIREPDLSAAELGALVRDVRTRLADAGDARARIVVNERVDVALAAEADGVHLKSDSIPTALVRRHVPAGVPGGPFRALRRRGARRRSGGRRLPDLRHRLPVRLEAARPPRRPASTRWRASRRPSGCPSWPSAASR